MPAVMTDQASVPPLDHRAQAHRHRALHLDALTFVRVLRPAFVVCLYETSSRVEKH